MGFTQMPTVSSQRHWELSWTTPALSPFLATNAASDFLCSLTMGSSRSSTLPLQRTTLRVTCDQRFPSRTICSRTSRISERGGPQEMTFLESRVVLEADETQTTTNCTF